MSKNIEVKVTGDTKELVIREGSALLLKEPVAVVVNGKISAPAEWISKRVDTINPECSHVLVDRERGTISLVLNESSAYATKVTGQITDAPELAVLPINTGKALTPLALSDLIKMHRYLFSTRDAALKLVSDLRSAKTKIDGYVERAKDDRGNFAQIRRQAIESTIPEGFDLSLPIVRGQNPIDVHVEIAINPDTLECTLLAPDLTEKQRALREELISKELEAIGNLLVIIEV